MRRRKGSARPEGVATFAFDVAEWTAGTAEAVVDEGGPFVPFAADPPDFSWGTGSDVARGEVTVPGRMPLGCKVWSSGSECRVGRRRPGPALGAGRAQVSLADQGLPFVSFTAFPPETFPRAYSLL